MTKSIIMLKIIIYLINIMEINLFILSLIQAIYIIYVLNYFETRYNFAHPLSNFSSDYFKHPIGKSNVPMSNICKFGHQVSWYLAMFIILRSFFINEYTKNISIFVLFITILLSMLNFNAVIYLIPHFAIEIYLIKNNYII